MRAIVRTTLLIVLLAAVGVAGWFLARPLNLPKAVQAEAGTTFPSYCVPPELTLLRDQLAHTTDASAREFLITKINVAERLASQCATGVALYPAAPRVTQTAGIPMPTRIPHATPTVQVGLVHAFLVPAGGSFVPVPDGLNVWADVVSGNIVQIVAGRITDQSGQAGSSEPSQGAVAVLVNNEGLTRRLLPTPTRHGTVHFLAACGTTLLLQSTDGTIFTFDAATLTYVDNSSACPTPTP